MVCFDYFTICLLISLAQGLRVQLLNSFPIKIVCLSKETPGVCNQVACFWTDYNLCCSITIFNSNHKIGSLSNLASPFWYCKIPLRIERDQPL